MEHLHDVLVAEEIVERLERQVALDRIHENRVLVVRSGHGELHEAELRPVGPLAQELGVYGDVGMRPRPCAEGSEVLGRGDGDHVGVVVLVLDRPVAEA